MKSSPFQTPVAAGRWPRCVPSASAALALAVVLSGCSTLQLPDAQLPPVAMPAGWSAAGAGGVATPLVQWWERLGDPELTALISEALAANTSVRSAQAALQQSRALVDVQTAGTLPRLGASGSAQRSRASGSTGNSFSAGFDASWEPDVFGRLRAGVNASEADARVAQASLADVQVSLAAEVAVNYIELRGLQQRLQIARSNLASQQETALIQPELVSLAGEAQRVSEYMTLVAEEKDVHLKVVREASPIPADRLLIQRAITNLVSNAIRHATEGSTVMIEIASKGATATLAVTNQGEAISPANQERIFDRFYRVDSGRDRLKGGTGLGLAIVRSIVAAHQGSVGVQSESGTTTFALVLPQL